MPNNDFISNILEIKDLIITNVESTSEEIHIYFKMKRRDHVCPCCGAVTNKVHDYRPSIIKDAPIVLLDEVTANMDVENELMIQMALQELLQDKTVIMIAHKLSTIKNVDQILVLENGKITQRGTHDQLVSQDGLYQKLWNIQYEASSWSI